MRVCAITNVLDEDFNLPIWLDYYGRQVGPENCVVVDRGSHRLPAMTSQSVVQTHRFPLHEWRRAQTITGIANTMLEYYDVVLYTDCDELLVPDPAQFDGLTDFFTRVPGPVYTAAGIDVTHRLDLEDPLDLSRPILSQRSHGSFNSWMCKTLATREPIQWGGGFHASSAPPAFQGLYLFHTAMVDMGERLKRAAQLRSFEWAEGQDPSYHRYPRMFSVNLYNAALGMEVRDFDAEVPALVDRALSSAQRAPDGLFYIGEDLRPPYLLRVPERFRASV